MCHVEVTATGKFSSLTRCRRAGKALGEGMNGYRPIVELMNTNFGIYGMAEISSAGNTYATTGGQFEMPMTIIGT